MNKAFALLVLFLCVFTLKVEAQPSYTCPKSIVAIHKNAVSELTGQTLKEIYAKLGCQIELFTRPGKRALSEFNTKKFDGEASRIEIVEKLYDLEFVRTRIPLFYVKGALWIHPDSSIHEGKPVGYVRGIVWQENHMKDKQGLIFNSYMEMYQAYEEGRIGSFLSPDQIVNHEVRKGTFKHIPTLNEEFFSTPIYHYLRAEFTPFMNVLSDYLEKHNSFTDFNKVSH